MYKHVLIIQFIHIHMLFERISRLYMTKRMKLKY